MREKLKMYVVLTYLKRTPGFSEFNTRHTHYVYCAQGKSILERNDNPH